MDPQPQTPDLAEIKERQQRAWASGDCAMHAGGFPALNPAERENLKAVAVRR